MSENIEQNTTPIIPQYYREDILGKQYPRLYRTFISGKRYYYYVDDRNNYYQFPSVTSITRSQMPVSDYLVKWYAEYGMQKAKELMNQKADYGTLLHICLLNYMINKQFDLATLPAIINNYKFEKRITYDTFNWKSDLEHDIAAWHVFAGEHNVETIAVGLLLCSHRLGYAGELDIIVSMYIGTGVNGNILKNDLKINTEGEIIQDKRKKVNVIIDWKSGRHGFYPDNEAQLHMYNNLFNDFYPDFNIDMVANWSPKDWSAEPDWTFKNQSESVEKLKIENYVKNFQLDESKKNEKIISDIDGKLQLGKINTLKIHTETFEERTKKIHQFKYGDEPIMNTTNLKLTNSTTEENLFVDNNERKAS